MPWTHAAALVLVSLVAVYYAAGTLAMYALARRRPPRRHEFPPVTILKPLAGLDDDLEENLRSFAALDYPRFQIVLGARDPADPALVIARRLIEAHPELDATIVVTGESPIPNPKVANLAVMASEARHELLVISDSNVRADRGYLRDLVGSLPDPDTLAVVTNVFVGTGAREIGARLENLHLATFQHRAVALVDLAFGRAPVLGKSMLLSKRTLAAIGGFETLGDYLAEDYVAGERVRRAGGRILLAGNLVRAVHRTGSVRSFLVHQLRWAVLRKRHTPAACALELATNGAFVSLVALFLWPGVWPWALGLALLQIALDRSVLARVRPGEIRAGDLPLLPLKDLLVAGVILASLFTNAVIWRGNRIEVAREGRLRRDRASGPPHPISTLGGAPRRDWLRCSPS